MPSRCRAHHPRCSLQTVLTYHVASGAVYSKDLTNGQKIPTLEGESLTVTIAGTNVKFNNANVVRADVAASNGVIHLIDGESQSQRARVRPHTYAAV